MARRSLIDFLPEAAPGWLREAKRQRPRARLGAVLGEQLPTRLADTLAERIGIAAELGNAPTSKLEAAERRSPTGPSRPAAPRASPRPR
jgi:predicted flavoprotein YhiN